MAKAIGYLKPDIDPNTRLYVPFNEGIGNVAKDYSQYGNHAQLTDVEWSPEGFNGAGKFNGSSSFGDCGNDASLNFTDNEHTILIWVKPSTIPIAAEGHHRVINKGNAVYWWDMDILRLSATTAKFEMVWDDDVVKKIASANDAFTLNTWYQAVGRREGTEYALFINGIKQTDTETVGSNFTAPNNVRIGKKPYGDAEHFEGIIGETMLYNRALSAAQNAADCYEVVCS